jgi:hypothetical protein
MHYYANTLCEIPNIGEGAKKLVLYLN